MNKKATLRTMVRLALVDDQFEQKERDYIKDLAKIYQVSNAELDQIISEEMGNKQGASFCLNNLDFEGKIEVLVDLVRVMKVDGEVYYSEVKFCEMIADNLGFKQKSIGFLAENIHSNPRIAPDWMQIQSRMKKYVA